MSSWCINNFWNLTKRSCSKEDILVAAILLLCLYTAQRSTFSCNYCMLILYNIANYTMGEGERGRGGEVKCGGEAQYLPGSPWSPPVASSNWLPKLSLKPPSDLVLQNLCRSCKFATYACLQDKAAQRRQSVFPVPVGLSKIPFFFWWDKYQTILIKQTNPQTLNLYFNASEILFIYDSSLSIQIHIPLSSIRSLFPCTPFDRHMAWKGNPHRPLRYEQEAFFSLFKTWSIKYVYQY